MADPDRRQDQRSPAGKWLDGVRDFVDEKRKEIGNGFTKDALGDKDKPKKKVK